MIKDLVDLIDKTAEAEVEGYCEYSVEYEFANNFYENPPKKILIQQMEDMNLFFQKILIFLKLKRLKNMKNQKKF